MSDEASQADAAPPKAFISYSWSSSEHEQWVIDLAKELVHFGVDVELDKWGLRDGHDKFEFMERMVSDPAVTKVMMICDRAYAEKANSRSGGVGTETQIITPELYEQGEQDKFVAIIAERDADGREFVPAFYKSRIYIDMSNEDARSENFERLLRWLYDKPVDIKPPLGSPPSFVTTDTPSPSETAFLARRVIDAFREGRAFATGSLREYLGVFGGAFASMRIDDKNPGDTFDDEIVSQIGTFLPRREEFVRVIAAATQYGDASRLADFVISFFEAQIPHLSTPRRSGHFFNWSEDAARFLVHELLLHTVGVLLREQEFDAVGSLASHVYFVGPDRPASGAVSGVGVFRHHLDSLAHRNARLKSNRISLRADMLKDRCETGLLSFDEIMQVDFVLLLADTVLAVRDDRRPDWWPDTLVFRSRWDAPFPLFMRATSKRHFERLRSAVCAESKEDLEAVVVAYRDGSLHPPAWEGTRVPVAFLMAWDTLATRT